ncbi:MAG TPA: hypothetical protein ENN40_06910 [Candidatus Aminicenantes bacterium]|nr:hypothetical protein [Candidatus Aminicenantes bacterium]
MNAIFRHRRLDILLFFSLILMITTGAAFPQEQIREYVRVNQLELIVRVIDPRGTPLSGLTKKDFAISENGLSVPITSCVEVKRRINSDSTAIGRFPQTPRFFLVYFWVWQDSEVYAKALDSIFDQIYREGDTLVLSLPTTTRVIQHRNDIPAIRKEFERDLQEWTRQRSRSLESIVANLNRLLRDLVENERLMRTADSDWGFRRAFETFRNSVLGDWQFFRGSFLNIPNRNFKRLAELMHGIKHQKWAIVFLQPPTFPTMHPNALIWTRFEDPGQAEQLRNFSNEMIRTMNSPHEPEVQLQAIEQAFLRCNTTFHLIRMDTHNDKADAYPDLTLREVFSDRQWTFQRLVGATGGKIISDNIPDRGLRRVADAEDVYYRLTYRPALEGNENDKDQRRLVITSSRPRVRIHHVRSIRLSEVEEIRLAEFHCDATRLKFILTGYAVRLEGEHLQSDVRVRITAESGKKEIQTFTRDFNTAEPFLQVSMAIHFPRSGHYRLHFHAEDRFTGHNVEENQVIQVILPDKRLVEPTGGERP